MVKGWTRIDMLLALYDRAITAVQASSLAKDANNESLMKTNILEAHKLILALHSGLKTEECEVAGNVARLLNFVMRRIEEHQFEEANHFLEQLHNSFSQIREEAIARERNGEIPPLDDANVVDTVA